MKIACLGRTALLLPLTTLAQEPFDLTIENAIELKVETEVGFTYDILAGDQLDNLQPLDRPFIGTGEVVSRFLPADEEVQFFRANRTAGAAAELLSGLTAVSTASALVSQDGDQIVVEGLRATADGVDFDDFITARYELDLASQSLRPVSLEFFADLGPTTVIDGTIYPLKDSAGNPTVTVNGTVVPPLDPVSLSIPSEGIEFEVTGLSGQFFGMNLQTSTSLRIIKSKTSETVITETSANQITLDEPFLKDSSLTLRLEPLNGSSTTVNLVHFNGNRMTNPVASGTSFQVTAVANRAYYEKLALDLLAGQRVEISGQFQNNSRFTLVNAAGERVSSQTLLTSSVSNEFFTLGPVPDDGTYLLIYTNAAGTENSGFSGTVEFLN
jgi:hypothetical protein